VEHPPGSANMLLRMNEHHTRHNIINLNKYKHVCWVYKFEHTCTRLTPIMKKRRVKACIHYNKEDFENMNTWCLDSYDVINW